jgi:hypothetical protein
MGLLVLSFRKLGSGIIFSFISFILFLILSPNSMVIELYPSVVINGTVTNQRIVVSEFGMVTLCMGLAFVALAISILHVGAIVYNFLKGGE